MIEELAMADPDKLAKLLRELLDKTGMGPDEHKLILTLKRQADIAIIKAYEERKKGKKQKKVGFASVWNAYEKIVAEHKDFEGITIRLTELELHLKIQFYMGRRVPMDQQQ